MTLKTIVNAHVYNISKESMTSKTGDNIEYYRAIVAQGSECDTFTISKDIAEDGSIKIGSLNSLELTIDTTNKKMKITAVKSAGGSSRPVPPVPSSSK